jgi:RNA polymerase sigma-70 factor (ECF subfamily)
MPSRVRSSEDPTVKRSLVVAGVGRVDEDALDAVEPLDMDEDAFRTFYDLTSSAVWAYLSHVTGDPHAADDLLQETYIRFLGVRRRWESDAHRRNYLFRIATNLAHDRHRRNRLRRAEPFDEMHGPGEDARLSSDCGYEQRADLRRALARLSPRDRQMLWLAYAEGSSHREIADALGLRAGGIRVLLFRARRKLASMLVGRPGEGRVR